MQTASRRTPWAQLSSYFSVAIMVTLALVTPTAFRANAQEANNARAVVTATTKPAESSVTVPRESITLYENRKPREISGWTPLRGERAGLQLVLLLDDSSRGNLSLQLSDIKTFLTALPPTAQVAIGYMRNGAANLTHGFTTDHATAAQSLRVPIGSAGINGSPYFCLSDLIKHWPGGDTNVRREVIMVTDGVDRYNGGRFDPEDPYVAAATSDAQKAGVIVYSIYYRGAGRFDQERLVTDGGQNYLTQLSDGTGGQVYLEGFGNPVSFSPFLSDIQHKLQNQYELTFVSTARSGLQPIRVKTSQPNTSLKWPAKVQAGEQGHPQ